MSNNLAVVYLSILLVLLAGVSISIFRQILKTRKTENALSRLQKKLTKEKGTVQEYYEMGSIFLDKKIYAQAIALFQKAIKVGEQEGEEKVAPIYNALGFAYFVQEQYDLAIRNYKEALKYDPNYVTVLNNLGHAYERKNLTTQALQAYEQALEAEPKNTNAKRRVESLRRRLVTSA